MTLRLFALLCFTSVALAEQPLQPTAPVSELRNGYLIDIWYPTPGAITEDPEHRLGYFFLNEFPFTLLTHKKYGQFEEFIRPVRYVGNATFVAEKAGTYTVVLDARLPPHFVFGHVSGQSSYPGRAIRAGSGINTIYDPHRKQTLTLRDSERVFNMVETSFYECEFYYLIDDKPVAKLEFQSQYPKRVPNELIGEYRNKQRCGDRKQTLGNIKLSAGVHTTRFGAQCHSSAVFREEAFHSRARFSAVESCPKDYPYWPRPHPYPGDGVQFIPFLRKPGSGEPVPMTPRDTYFEDPR